MNENTRYGMRRSKLNSSSAKGIRAVQRAMVESKFDTALAGTEDTRRTRLVSRALCGMAEWPCSSGTCPNGLSSVVGRNVSQASWRSSLGFGVAGESNSLAASSSVRSVKVGSSSRARFVCCSNWYVGMCCATMGSARSQWSFATNAYLNQATSRLITVPVVSR